MTSGKNPTEELVRTGQMITTGSMGISTPQPAAETREGLLNPSGQLPPAAEPVAPVRRERGPVWRHVNDWWQKYGAHARYLGDRTPYLMLQPGTNLDEAVTDDEWNRLQKFFGLTGDQGILFEVLQRPVELQGQQLTTEPEGYENVFTPTPNEIAGAETGGAKDS